MPLQVLPPGVTSLSARQTPSFTAPLIGSTDPATLAASVLAQDPRSIISPNDIYTLRVWVKSIMGNSWRDDVTLDDLMRQRPQILYKAVCLYLQGRYWGQLDNDYLSEGGLVPLDWPNKDSVLEQGVATWDLKMVPVAAPAGLAEDVNGALWLPMITPSMLVSKFDVSRGAWRVYEAGGYARSFVRRSPGGVWEMRGWDFGEWAATNADFFMVIKIVGFAVIATAAVISGGAALAAGGAFVEIATAAGSAAATASQLFSAASSFMRAVAQGPSGLGAALDALAGVVKVGLGVDLKALSNYQPGIDLASNTADVIKPYLDAVISLGGNTGGEFLKTLMQAGQDVKLFVDGAQKFATQLSVDATKFVTGQFPDALLQAVPTMGTDKLGQIAAGITADYTNRANAAIKSIEAQVPRYLNDWKERGRSAVKQLGFDKASTKSPEIPWFGRTAYDAGTIVGDLQARVSATAAGDINALTPAQKRALFFGDIVQVCTADPNCLRNAAEYLRQADLVWADLQKYVDYYKLRPVAK